MELLSLLVTVVLWGLIFYILWWGLGKAEPEEPWKKVATSILVIATVFVLIGILTGSIEPFPFVAKLF